MCTTKLSVVTAVLSLLALGLGPGAGLAHAQGRRHVDVEHEAPPPVEAPRTDPDLAAQSRLQLGLGIAGIITGAVGLAGGIVLLIAGTTRTHCTGDLFFGTHSCTRLPADAGDLAGGGLSLGLGLVAVVTSIVLFATRPRPSRPQLALGGDWSSVSVAISGTF